MWKHTSGLSTPVLDMEESLAKERGWKKEGEPEPSPQSIDSPPAGTKPKRALVDNPALAPTGRLFDSGMEKGD